MSTTTPDTDRTEIPTPPPRKPRKALKLGLGVMTVGLALAIGIGVGASGNHATMAPAAKPAATAPAAPAPATSAPAAPSTPAEQAPEQSTYDAPIGSTLTLTDDSDGSKWEVTVNSVAPFHQGEYDDPPGAGYHYIKANVTYHALSGKVSANEWDWTAKDSTGQTYELASVSGGSTDLSATDISAGQKLRGDVEFKVPNGKDLTLVYSSGMSEQASWVVPASTQTAARVKPAQAPAAQAVQAAPAAGMDLRDIGGGVYAGSATSTAFAQNVVAAWRQDPTAGVKQVYSPVTGQTYAMTYSTVGAGTVIATGGNGAYVQF